MDLLYVFNGLVSGPSERIFTVERDVGEWAIEDWGSGTQSLSGFWVAQLHYGSHCRAGMGNRSKGPTLIYNLPILQFKRCH